MTRQDGFTLIEMLVSLSLLALLSLLLFGGMRFGVRAWDRNAAHGAGMDDLRVVRGLVQREIESAWPAYVVTDPVHPVVDFEGDGRTMNFIAPQPQAADSSGRARVTFATARQGRHLALVMRLRPELAAGGESSDTLLSNAAALRFSYYGSPAGGTPSWRGDWPKSSRAPILVRIHVDFAKGDGRIWPDLIVAPRIEADSGCVYDFATHYCQGRS